MLTQDKAFCGHVLLHFFRMYLDMKVLGQMETLFVF